MKDAFGRLIKEGDVVVFASRASSTTYLRVAKVLRVTDGDARVNVIAGNDSDWTHGKFTFRGPKCERVAMEGYETTIRAESNVMVANGIDADGIHESLVLAQRERMKASDS